MRTVREIIFLFVGIGVLLSILLTILFRLDLPVCIQVIIVIGICVGTGFLISWYFSERIESLYAGVQIMRSGNLDYKVNTYSEDGIGKLSKEFDKVAAELKRNNEALALARAEIVEKKEAISELKKREESFRKLFEESNDSVFVYDFDGKMIEVNNKACDMLGYPQNIMAGVNFFDLQVESELTVSKAAVKTGEKVCAIRYESKMKRANGEVLDVEVSTSIIDLKKGVVQSIVSNITGRKNMQKELEESEEKFRTFMETASDLMFIADVQGKLTYVNNAMANTLGYLREEIQNLHMTDILSQESLDADRKIEKVIREKGEVLYESIWETKHRKKIYGEMTKVAIFNKAGEFTGSRGIFRDITERKKVEESMRLANLGKLAADVAHEVNNPITIILGRAELLLIEKKEDKELQEKLNVIIEQCGAAISIMKRLLQFSRPSKKEFKGVNVNEMVKTVINLIEHQFQGYGIVINTYFADVLPEVNADEKQIQEVFMNLMRNAGEAMPGGGRIDIHTYEKEGNIYADIKDNGSGISEEDVKKIFDPFFTTKENGTGLGLSVCYGIMKSHNGDLQCFSKAGEGTTARVIFPVKQT